MASTGQTLSSFTCFPRLPVELQLRSLELASLQVDHFAIRSCVRANLGQSCQVPLTSAYQIYDEHAGVWDAELSSLTIGSVFFVFRGTETLPQLLSTCRLSRQVALKFIKRLIPGHYVKFQKSVRYAHETDRGKFITLFNGLGEFIEQMKR